jgi:hypothetical protein
MAQGDVNKLANEGALHVTWNFPFADSVSVSKLHSRLVAGQKSRLFDIRLWDCRDGQVSAVLALEAPYDVIMEHIRSTGHQPSSLWMEKGSDKRPERSPSFGQKPPRP